MLPYVLKPVQDEEIRWWSTFIMVDQVVQASGQKWRLAFCKRVDHFMVVEPVMEPLMPAPKLMEGKKWVTVNLLVRYISDPRDGLSHGSDNLKLPSSVPDLCVECPHPSPPQVLWPKDGTST